MRERSAHAAPRILPKGVAAERDLMRVLLRDPGRLEAIAEHVGPDGFLDPRYRAMFSAMLEARDVRIDELANSLPEDAVTEMQRLADEPGAIVDIDRTIDDCISKLKSRDLDQQNRVISQAMSLASDAEKDALSTQKTKNAREKMQINKR